MGKIKQALMAVTEDDMQLVKKRTEYEQQVVEYIKKALANA